MSDTGCKRSWIIEGITSVLDLEELRSFTAVACLNYCCPRSLINWGIFTINRFEGNYYGLFKLIMSANGGRKRGKLRKRRLATGPNVHIVITMKICTFCQCTFMAYLLYWRDYWEDSGVGWRIILKWSSKNSLGKQRCFIWRRREYVVGWC
jgi:hypothetical protein